MTRRVIVHPQARLDLAAACDWYEGQRSGFGNEFLGAFAETVQLVTDNPFQYQKVYGRFRRALFGKFPYSLIYTVSESEIAIISCFHCSRDPKRWQDLP